MSNPPRIVAIIQARMSSTRLPGKVMADLAGRPLLARVIERARAAKSVDLVAVATTDRAADDRVAEFCSAGQIPVFRGSEDDVLDRFRQAAARFEADVVVRLTADCPLLDAAVIDLVVGSFLTGNCDYASNTIEPTYPDGLDTEVFSREALERAWREAKLKSEREHVTPYIWKNPAFFRLLSVKNDVNLSGLRWTVDEPQDLELARRVYQELSGRGVFRMNDVMGAFRRHPEWAEINTGFARNEGYEKSLREDASNRGIKP